MQIFTMENEYLLQVADMKEPFDQIRFNLERVSFEDVVAAVRAQYPDRHELIIYKHGNTVAIQQSGGTCGIGRSGVAV